MFRTIGSRYIVTSTIIIRGKVYDYAIMDWNA